MYLSSIEERIINGEFGSAKALALKVIVKVGESLGAQELITINHAHVSGISYLNIGDSGIEFIEDVVASGGSVEVFTSANPYMVISDYLGKKHADQTIEKQLRIINSLNKIGVKFYTCAPYNVRPPRFGEHLAWAESNAVLYANTVLGALSNKEGGPLALLAGIVGRTYKSGVHILSNRKPKVLINSAGVNESEVGFLGLMIGELVGERIPYISGLKFRDTYHLKLFLAALGTTSNIPMAVIEEVTPEYKELMRDVSYEEVFNLSYSDIKSYVRRFMCEVISGRGLYLIGCPHLSFNELVHVLNRLLSEINNVRGPLDLGSRELWLTTYEGFVSNAVLELVNGLAKYNVKVLPNVCAVVSRLDLLGVDYVVTDSTKACSYISRLSKIPVLVVPTNDLIKMYFTNKLSVDL
ncbi:MAG: aconitase X catalytic domain-containing protein [Sulfolobales archaeon]